MSLETTGDEMVGIFPVDFLDCPAFNILTVDDCAEDELRRRRFEPMSMKLWCKLARSATSIIDIGANIGFYALAAASLRRDIDIHAFEPNPWAYTRLRVNKRINKFSHIQEHTYGLSHTSGIARLSWARKGGTHISTGGTFIRTDHTGLDTAPADLRVFDEIGIGLGARGLIKIDVEGAELSVFKGMANSIHARPDIFVECFAQAVCDRIFGMLQPFGYAAYLINENEMSIEKRENLVKSEKEAKNYNRLLSVHEDIEALLET